MYSPVHFVLAKHPNGEGSGEGVSSDANRWSSRYHLMSARLMVNGFASPLPGQNLNALQMKGVVCFHLQATGCDHGR
jgi:hypothetical protein